MLGIYSMQSTILGIRDEINRPYENCIHIKLIFYQ